MRRNAKRLVAMLLAFGLVLGQISPAYAVTVSENTVEKNTVSANATEEVVEPQKAYNGTPSKVINLEAQYNKDGEYLFLGWNPISTENKILTPDGKAINIGYQVEENGKVVSNVEYISTDGAYAFSDSSYYYSELKPAVGAAVTYRVRGLYYTETQIGETVNYQVVSVGEWSDLYTYTRKETVKLSEVTGLTYKIDQSGTTNEIYLTWNLNPGVARYRVEIISSNVPVTGLTKDNWSSFFKKKGDAYQKFTSENPGVYIATNTSYVSDTYYSRDIASTYYYFRVYQSSAKEGYEISSAGSEMLAYDATQLQKNIVPKLENFAVEYSADGETFYLTWTAPKKGNVVIYAYELPTFPKNYYYAILNASTADGDYIGYMMDPAFRQVIDYKVQYYTTSAMSEKVNSGSFKLDPGKTYYFVAHTYDQSHLYETRTPITVDGVQYTRYADVGPASAVVSAKVKVRKPAVYTESNKKEITLSMEGEGTYTGFEIYRKNGKKYKKIRTTTDSVYVDKDLKEGTSYSYKVRAYWYDKDTKKKLYSAYDYVVGETSPVQRFDLSARQKSKSSVSLVWTKMKGITKYEIYRATSDYGNPNEVSKYNSATKKRKYGTGGEKKYELVKTINKGSATSYTDKGLSGNKTYYYRVVAYYKVGKKLRCMQMEDSIYMGITTPVLNRELKGTTVKFIWDKNAFASKYELKYTMYDACGREMGEEVKVTTSKTTYTVKNIPLGGYITARLRTVSKDNKYSAWSSQESVFTGLDVAKSIKASNVLVKKSSGEQVNAVKISWKPVNGAKYYKVYRSKEISCCDVDTKRYYVSPGTNMQLIAKESNDDETLSYSQAFYEEYMGESGSVVSTTAYDFAQLDDGVNYYYYVVAFGEVGTNVYSTYALFSSGEGSSKPACVAYKGNVKVSSIKNSKKGQVVLKWNKITGTKKYYVYRSTNKKSGYKLVGTTKKSSFTDKKVSKGKTYYYKVVAEGSNALKADFSFPSSVKKIKVKK